MAKKLIPMAIAYDFDGTLAPDNMQEHRFLPDIKMKPKAFWAEAKRLTKEQQGDEVLIYMNLMLKKADAADVPVRREDFKAYGRTIELFEGVPGWFDRITAYGRTRGVKVEHFLLSSGNAEIIAGTPIAKKFKMIYASKFMFDANDRAQWPALAVNFTTKTQYLFRINKDAHDLSDSKKVNQVVAKGKRPVPFENMVFIGDGSTDIPCFSLLKNQGGLSVAVYKPHTPGAGNKAKGFLDSGRVHCAVPAIYTEDSDLDRIVKARIDMLAARANLASLVTEVPG